MKIRRYKERIATDWILDAEMGDWCRYEDVKPLLERIKELRDEWYTRDLKQSDFDSIIAELTGDEDET